MEKLYTFYDLQDESNKFTGTISEGKAWLIDFWQFNPYSEEDLEEMEEYNEEKHMEEIKHATEEELFDMLSGIDWTLELNAYETIKQALDRLPHAEGKEADDLHQAIQESFDTHVNDLNIAKPLQVYLIHDNLYLTKEIAELFEDGKESVSTHWIILEANTKVTEGACYHYLCSTEGQAWDIIWEEMI